MNSTSCVGALPGGRGSCVDPVPRDVDCAVLTHDHINEPMQIMCGLLREGLAPAELSTVLAEREAGHFGAAGKETDPERALRMTWSRDPDRTTGEKGSAATASTPSRCVPQPGHRSPLRSDVVENNDEAVGAPRWRQFVTFRWILVSLLAILAILWLAPTVVTLLGNIDLAGFEHPHLWVFGFVLLDAIIPIFPSESLLTTGSNLAAQDGSSLVLWRLTLAGALGATLGDSLLYWLSRTVLRDYMSQRVDQAAANPKIAKAIDVLHTNAAAIIAFGRFVPGLRFVVAATMGVTAYKYPTFLLWSAVGGTAWASFTCIFSFAIASVVDDKPVLSIVLSVLVTTGLLALLYRPLKKSWEESDPGPPAIKPEPTD
jgi:membrane-associated protein